ncbi:uncharacterized protein LOC128280697 isoform X2 [Gossypium arboreum]|nr:uncharacterized protein LOC128280697 isoform X2 [Gossypium arboreum]
MIAIPQKSFTLLLSISLKTFFHLNSAALNLAFLVSDSPSRDEHGLDPPLQVIPRLRRISAIEDSAVTTVLEPHDSLWPVMGCLLGFKRRLDTYNNR